jgi:hypothetical protein
LAAITLLSGRDAFVTLFIQTALFLWKRRLLPLIITHYVADLSPGITALLFVY